MVWIMMVMGKFVRGWVREQNQNSKCLLYHNNIYKVYHPMLNMDTNNFGDLKEGFIVDKEEYSKEKVKGLVEIVSSFCKVTKKGEVFILKKVSTRKVLKLILGARFIAHILDNSIPEEVSRKELEAYSNMKKKVFIARFNEMLRENFAEKEENSKLKAKNILVLEQFLEQLKEKQKI